MRVGGLLDGCFMYLQFNLNSTIYNIHNIPGSKIDASAVHVSAVQLNSSSTIYGSNGTSQSASP